MINVGRGKVDRWAAQYSPRNARPRGTQRIAWALTGKGSQMKVFGSIWLSLNE